MTREFLLTGELAEVERLRGLYPREAVRMASLPRLTSRRLRVLKHDLGVEHLADLLTVIRGGQVAAIPGVGPATAALWEQVLSGRPDMTSRPIHEATGLLSRVQAHLRLHVPGHQAEAAGAVRRLDEWVPALDLEVTGDPTPVERFLSQSAITPGPVLAHGSKVEVPIHESIPLLVGRSTPREGGGEPGGRGRERLSVGRVEAAARLVGFADVRGDLHLHSDWSPDGHQTLEGLVEACSTRGYSYLAITDHAIGLRFGGLDAAALARQRIEVEKLRQHTEVGILHSAELNIARDGSLDYGEEALDALDLGLAAVHSFFGLGEEEQTNRVIRAIEHPRVKVIGHLTGRRIGIRPPISLDLERVMAAAARTGTALEVNGHLDRLDLSLSLVRRALANGVLLAANSDAHRLEELENIGNAISVIRRAGAGPEQVVNTWPVDRFTEWARR
jgi:DNA polymerase (family 10)